MALVKPRTLSVRRSAANLRNALKSTGPRTPAGRRRSSLNALKHGLYTRSQLEAMVDLGEDTREFHRLHRGLISSLEPANPLEKVLVGDLAGLWWKKARAERAQAAVQWREIEKLEMERLRQAHEVNRETFDDSEAEVVQVGLRRSKDCPAKFEEAYKFLEYLRQMVERGDWSELADGACKALYGKNPTWRGGLILDLFHRLREAGAPPPPLPEDDPSGHDPGAESDEMTELAVQLRFLILQEIRDVISEHELFALERFQISRAMRRACLAPGDSRWALILRQEASLERQIDRKLRLLLQLKKARSGPRKDTAESPCSPREKSEKGMVN